MVAFAVGGLLGDTLFHLLPEIFLGEDSAARATFVLVEPNRNLLLGLAILVGFLVFVAIDKGLRLATAGAGAGDAHGHGQHAHAHASDRRPTRSPPAAHGASSTRCDVGRPLVLSRKRPVLNTLGSADVTPGREPRRWDRRHTGGRCQSERETGRLPEHDVGCPTLTLEVAPANGEAWRQRRLYP